MRHVSVLGRGAALAAGAVLVLLAAPRRLAAETPALKTGTILKRTYEFKQARKAMEYCLYVPKAYDKSKAWPLMVALHGLYSSPWRILNYPGLTKQAEKHGFIVVAPMGYNTRGWYGSRGWTMRRSSPKDLGELSEKDVMNVLAITRRELNIDNRRIYLMGHSMGGGGTWHLGIKYPSLWAGLAPIAPAIYRSPDALARIKAMPVILVQGDADRLVPVAMARRWAAKMKQLKMDYSYIEVAGGGHVRIAFDNLPKIFEFLSRRKRKVPAKPVAPAPATKPSATGGPVRAVPLLSTGRRSLLLGRAVRGAESRSRGAGLAGGGLRVVECARALRASTRLASEAHPTAGLAGRRVAVAAGRGRRSHDSAAASVHAYRPTRRRGKVPESPGAPGRPPPCPVRRQTKKTAQEAEQRLTSPISGPTGSRGL